MSSKNLLDNIKKLRELTVVGFKDCKIAIDENNGDIEKSIEFLRKKGIATNIHYRNPTHKTKAFDDGTVLTKTEYICKNIISLPCYHTLPEHHQDYIINAIKEFYAN